MIFVFVITVLVFGMLFVVSKGKYCEVIAHVDKKDYPLRDFIPIGLYILDKINYRFDTKYDQYLLGKILELHDFQDIRYYLKVHWGNKIGFMVVIILVMGFAGIGWGNFDFTYIFFSVGLLGLVFYLTDKELNEKIKKRRLKIMIDFPDFINKVTLLINAGMPILKAWGKIVTDSRSHKDQSERPLYVEAYRTFLEIKAGKPEIKAYEDFAKRCRVPEITRFAAIIIQNLRKGNAELVPVLRLQALECWEMRKNIARKLGEEASTKLLAPMMIMFIGILIIIIMPAVMQLGGF